MKTGREREPRDEKLGRKADRRFGNIFCMLSFKSSCAGASLVVFFMKPRKSIHSDFNEVDRN